MILQRFKIVFAGGMGAGKTEAIRYSQRFLYCKRRLSTQMHSATTGVKVDLAKETKDAQEAIAKHPELTATIRMKYKQRTGKDLP